MNDPVFYSQYLFQDKIKNIRQPRSEEGGINQEHVATKLEERIVPTEPVNRFHPAGNPTTQRVTAITQRVDRFYPAGNCYPAGKIVSGLDKQKDPMKLQPCKIALIDPLK